MRASIPTMPVNLALKSYKAAGQVPEEAVAPVEAEDERTQVIRLHDAGQSIEEIAKQLGKGRTEDRVNLEIQMKWLQKDIYGILSNGITTHVDGRQEWCREVVLADEVHGGN